MVDLGYGYILRVLLNPVLWGVTIRSFALVHKIAVFFFSFQKWYRETDYVNSRVCLLKRIDAFEAPLFQSSDSNNSLEKSLMLGRLRAEGEGGIRGWDCWMASLMQWIWTWANSGRWWGTGRPGGLQSMGSQIVRHDWATEKRCCCPGDKLNAIWTEYKALFSSE